MLEVENRCCALNARVSVIPESWLFTSENQQTTPQAAPSLRDPTPVSHPKDLRVAHRPSWLYRSPDANGTGSFLLRDSLDRLELSIKTPIIALRLGRQAVTTGHALLLPVTEVFYPLGSQSELTETQIGVDGILAEATPDIIPDTSFTLGMFPGLSNQAGENFLPKSIRILMGLRHYGQNSDLSLFALGEPTAIWLTGGVGWGWEIFTLSGDALIWAPRDVNSTASPLTRVDVRARSTWGVTAAPSGDATLRVEWAWNDPRIRSSVRPGQSVEGIVSPSQFQWIDQHLFAARLTRLVNVQSQVQYSLVYRPRPPTEILGKPTLLNKKRSSALLMHSMSFTWDLDDRSTFQATIGQTRTNDLGKVSAWTGRLALVSTY